VYLPFVLGIFKSPHLCSTINKIKKSEVGSFSVELGSNNLLNNEVASGNFSQNTLVSFDGIFNGLEKVVAWIVPSARNALVERYRAETFLKIGLKAQEITQKLGIEIQPIPPKAALPLFDKLSLEHEEDMYDAWARLLVAASDEYNPVQIQYAEILSKIGHAEATILKTIYEYQDKNNGVESLFDGKRLIEKYNKEIQLEEIIDEINGNLDVEEIVGYGGINSTPEISIKYNTIKTPNLNFLYEDSTGIYDEINIQLLDNLALIERWQVDSKVYIVLTSFGYNFIETLEKYSIAKN